MQFGIFTVGDVTTDPTTGTTVSEHERIKGTIAIAKKAEEVGLDVFATGEHHNPPFIASAPTTTLAFLGDVFYLPRPLPFANVFSIGDVLIAAGGAWFIARTMVGRVQPSVAAPTVQAVQPRPANG